MSDLMVGEEVTVAADETPAAARDAQPGPHTVTRHLQDNPVMQDLMADDPASFSTVQACILAAKAPGTVSAYSGTLRRLERFCSDNSVVYPDFTPEILLMYIVHLVRLKVSFQTLANLKPAITYLDSTLGRASCFTAFLDLVLKGAKRAAAAGPVKKAPLPIELIHEVLDKLYLPHLPTCATIDPTHFRTIFRLVVEYHTLYRLNCFRSLQARHFEQVAEDILVTFPRAKNDQFHEGRSSFLNAAPDDPYCPVKLVINYFNRFSLAFGAAANDPSFVNFQLQKQAGQVLSIKHKSLSASGATDSLRLTFKAAGCTHPKLTDKSI
jgi:hypothetical protein